MFNKIISIVLSFSLVFSPLAASAALSEAFNSLVPNTAVGTEETKVLASRARTAVSLGGLSVRFPSSPTPQLFSATAPQFSVGCNGVNAHFGGFSFISGKNIERFIQNIIQGAPGFILSMVIKTMCPQCEAVLQVMQKLAQAASLNAMDACKLSQKLAADAVNGLGLTPGAKSGIKKDICGATVAVENQAIDFLGALETVCETAEDAAAEVKRLFESKKEGKTEAEKEALDIAEGNANELTNSTWTVLKALNFDPNNDIDYRMMLLMMNMVGTQAWTSEVDYSSNLPRQAIPPAFRTPAQLIDLMMCGLRSSQSPKAIRVFEENSQIASHCSGLYGQFEKDAAKKNVNLEQFYANAKVLQCAERTQCHAVTQVSLKESTIFEGEGFVIEVHHLLMEAVERVMNDQQLDARHLQLLTSSPIPMYQAINAAAVYPLQAGAIVGNLSLFYSQLLAHGMFDRFISQFARIGGKPLGDHEKVYTTMRAVITDFNVAQKKQLVDLVESWKGTQFISEQIRLLNLSIQKEVLTSEMAHSNAMATAIKRSTESQEAP